MTAQEVMVVIDEEIKAAKWSFDSMLKTYADTKFDDGGLERSMLVWKSRIGALQDLRYRLMQTLTYGKLGQ